MAHSSKNGTFLQKCHIPPKMSHSSKIGTPSKNSTFLQKRHIPPKMAHSCQENWNYWSEDKFWYESYVIIELQFLSIMNIKGMAHLFKNGAFIPKWHIYENGTFVPKWHIHPKMAHLSKWHIYPKMSNIYPKWHIYSKLKLPLESRGNNLNWMLIQLQKWCLWCLVLVIEDELYVKQEFFNLER